MSQEVRNIIALSLRAFAFYLAFALIAAGALTLGNIIIPALTLLNPNRSKLENRKLLSTAASYYLNLLSASGLLEISCSGLSPEIKDKPLVFAANHPSLLDAVFFISRFPTCVVIIKSKLMRFSPYSQAARAAGYIVNSSSSEIITPLCDELYQGNPVVIFPEGTRTGFPEEANHKTETCLEDLKFHRGAAAVSLRSSTPIVPVLINYSPMVLGRGQSWHQVPNRLCKAKIKFFKPTSLGPVENSKLQDDTPASRRELTEKLEDFFKEWLTEWPQKSNSENFQRPTFHAKF